MRTLRNELSSHERSLLSQVAIQRLRSLDVFKTARTIASYRAIDGEIDPKAIRDGCRERGKRICYPRVTDSKQMEFSEAASWQPYRFGYAPVGKEVTLDEIDLMLVPGVAFTLCGQRLGFGGGFYDRVLANFDGFSVGLAYPFQICSELHTEAWDMNVDYVISP